MRMRAAAWRTMAPSLGRVAPAAARAYYDAVTRSLVRSIARTRDVHAVYAHGSYALGELKLGESDVDVLAVTEDASVDGEVAQLERLRRAYRRHQAVLPLDLSVVPRSEFALGAPWHAFLRMRIGSAEPVCALGRWRLLHGEECRNGEWRPDPRLAYLTESHVLEPLDACARRDRRAVGDGLAKLARDAARERLEWPAALALDEARERLRHADATDEDAVAAIHAALAVVDEQRRRNPIPCDEVPADAHEWSAEAVPDAVAARSGALAALVAGAPARSLTLYLPPFQRTPLLLLEAGGLDEARAVVRAAVAAAPEAASAGVRLLVLTSRLAEDSWRSGVRFVPLVAASQHVGGEPLVPRLRVPAPAWQRQLALGRALTTAAFARWRLLGLRRFPRVDRLPFELAACRVLVAGAPPATDPVVLARRVPELAGLAERDVAALDEVALGRLCLRVWRACLALVEKDDAFAPQPLPVE